MAYPHERRIDVYAEAREGLVELEPNPEKQIKDSAFIDLYAGLDEKNLVVTGKNICQKVPIRRQLWVSHGCISMKEDRKT